VNYLKDMISKVACVLLSTAYCWAAHAHSTSPWGPPLDWHDAQIEDVIGVAQSGAKITVDGRSCISGGMLYFKIKDDYAFDIDERVWIDFEFYLNPAKTDLRLAYDGVKSNSRGWENTSQTIQLPAGGDSRWFTQTVPLKRARFANLGMLEGADFSLSAIPDPGAAQLQSHQFTICGIKVRRSYLTTKVNAYGAASIKVVDRDGRPTPVRMGIYDQSGRMPLPSGEALLLKNGLTGASRVISIGGKLPAWPVDNRTAFYTEGQYHARLPVGEYELVVAKGPEYRLIRQKFMVGENRATDILLKLTRWKDMETSGWFSGEDHIHYARNSSRDDHDLQIFTRAEDVKVANILQFGNSAQTYYDHYDWKHVVVHDHGRSFVLAPGQEDPRTSRLGHTAMLNIKSTLRDPDSYLLYSKIFDQAHAQGGLAGYAHVDDGWLNRMHNAARGLAVDVPFGIVDFAQILTFAETGAGVWFDFLNLGYKIAPTAGTDYPIDAVPGTYRNYVHIPQGFTPQAWFDGLKSGHTFVTSGPMLTLHVNGHGMGSELHLRAGEQLMIQAKASLNPDIDSLASLELIEQGDVVKVVKSEAGLEHIEFLYDAPATHGSWFVLRARGKRNGSVVALSAPIYLIVNGDNFWKRSAVRGIVAKMKGKMEEIFAQPEGDFTWEVGMGGEFVEHWNAQRSALRQRVDQAEAEYDDLLKRVAESANP